MAWLNRLNVSNSSANENEGRAASSTLAPRLARSVAAWQTAAETGASDRRILVVGPHGDPQLLRVVDDGTFRPGSHPVKRCRAVNDVNDQCKVSS